MPVTSDLGGKEYTLGRGKTFFDRFPNNVTIDANTVGEGEFYMGNTPEFNTTSESEDLEHFSSDAGVNEKDDSVQLSNTRNGSFTTDNISSRNAALWFLGSADVLTQASATGATSEYTVKRGAFYQLGQDATNPTGVRGVSNVTCGKGAGFSTPVAAANNFEIDEPRGRVYVLPDAVDIADGELLQFTFDVEAGTRTQTISSSNAIYGALRFVADNPKGENRDYYYPYVKLTPSGDYALKGDDWLTMSFDFEVLKKGSLEAVYIDGQHVTS